MNDDLRSRFRTMADRVEGQVDAAAAWHTRTEQNRPSGLLVASAAAFTIMVAIGGVLAIRTIGVGPTDTTSPTVHGHHDRRPIRSRPPRSRRRNPPPRRHRPRQPRPFRRPSSSTRPPPTSWPMRRPSRCVPLDGTELLANLAAGTSVYYGHESTRSADGRVLWLVAAAEPIEWFGPPIPPDEQGSLMGWVDPEHLRSIPTYQAVAGVRSPGHDRENGIEWRRSPTG